MQCLNDNLIMPALSRRAVLLGLCSGTWWAHAATAPSRVPILVYHRFGATAVDSMTVSTPRFQSHLAVLSELGCQVISLHEWVAYRRGERPSLPERAVVLTADDGHRSQAEVLAPALAERGWPVTLFIYPSAISNASYAMTWDQLRQWRRQPSVMIESHTYWHPNLVRERRNMDATAFERFATTQLTRSKAVLQDKLGQEVSLLAWPFGLSDPGLQQLAHTCGYRAAFALENRSATLTDPVYAVPRHLMVDSVSAGELKRRLMAAFSAPLTSPENPT